MENDRGARPPSCHVARYGRTNMAAVDHVENLNFFTVKSIYTCNTLKPTECSV